MAVPFAIASNGAKHSGEVARTLAYAATHGSEGIISIGDMTVQQLAVAGASVQVLPGACAMLNRSPGGDHQTYIDRELETVQLAIAATSSGGGRSDLIIRRVEDPDYPSWAIPVDPINGPYSRYVVISGVPNTTTTAKQLNLGYPAIALARIDIPVSTATITTAMIKLLAKICNPRRQREVDSVFPSAAQAITSTTVWKVLGTSRAIEVPEWATTLTFSGNLSGLALLVGNTYGYLQANFAGLGGQTTLYDENWVSPAAGYSRCSYSVLGEIPIPLAMRGTSQTLIFYGKKISGAGYLQADTGSSLFCDLEFLEKAY